MKVLFLDIDGVLNSTQTAREHHSWMILSPEKLSFIKHLHNAGVEIVVSSTWRKGRTLEELSTILGVKVYSKTPSLHSMQGCRGDEIDVWLKENNFPEYCIIDDDWDMLKHQDDFFVHTNIDVGMEFEHLQKICQILHLPIPKE